MPQCPLCHTIKAWNYSQFVDERYKNKAERKILLSLKDDVLFLKDEGSETNIKLTEIDAIYDIGSNIFLHLQSETSVIIPRNQSNTDAVENLIGQLEEQTGVDRNTLDWKWK